MRFEFIPVIILLSLLAIQYFIAKRRATVAVKTVTVVEEEGQKTTTTPVARKTVRERIEEFAKNEDRFWLLGFIVVAVITILLYTVLDEKSSDRWVTVGLITLVGMHVFIFWNFFQALFYEDKLHPSTKFFLGGCLIFWSIALFVPNFAQEIVKGTKGMVTAFDDRFDPEKASAKAETEQQPSSEAISSLGLSTVAIVVPVGATIEVDRPSGHYLASVNCPKEVVMEVTDVSTGQLIKQQDCAETVRNGNLPLNIKLAFFQKGDDGGPVDVLVRWKKIS